MQAAHWLGHIEHDADSPVWAPWLRELGRIGAFVRYDQRGCGLSDRDAPDVSLERMVEDLSAVVDALGLKRFVLLGMSQGGAIATLYARRHPNRVAGLVLLGAYPRGLLARGGGARAEEEARLLTDLMRLGWGQDHSAFRSVFTELFVPGGTREQHEWWSDLQRKAARPGDAVRILEALHRIDVTEDARSCGLPALVAHMRGDRRVPMEEGRLFATLLPEARFLPLEGSNHVPLDGEPAFVTFMEALEAFVADVLPATSATSGSRLDRAGLTGAEAEVLALVARGLDNSEIGHVLGKSPKTVRNQVSVAIQKIGAPTRAAAVAMVLSDGLPDRMAMRGTSS